MNLNKTMKHFGLAGTGVIVLLLMVVVYYLNLIKENTSLEGFGVGGQFAPQESWSTGSLTPAQQVIRAQHADKVFKGDPTAHAVGGDALQLKVRAAKAGRAGATNMEEANQYRANASAGAGAEARLAGWQQRAAAGNTR